MSIGSLVILYDKNDCDVFLKSKANVDEILTLTPNSYCYIKPYYGNIIRSTDQFLNSDHESVIDRVRNIEENYLINDTLNFFKHKCVRDTFISKVHLYLSMCERLWITIPTADKYYYVIGHKIYSSSSKRSVFLKIICRLIEGDYSLKSNIRPSIYSPIINFFNYFSSKQIRKFNVIVYTGKGYGFENLIQSYKKHDSGLRFVRFRGSENNFKDLLIASKTLIDVILNKKELVFLISPTLPTTPDEEHEIAFSLEAPHLNDAVTVYKKYLMLDLQTTEGMYHRFLDVLYVINPFLLVAHEVKYRTNAALANAAFELNIESYLISHGTHVYGNKEYADFEHMHMARGILGSDMVKTNVVQSSVALNAIKSFFPKYNYVRFNPIMWGFLECSKSNYGDKDDGILHILHASTFKAFTAYRPWIFETSDEFYEGIRELIDVVSKVSNVFLTIRLRDAPECDVALISSLVSLVDNIKLKSDGKFIDALSRSDLLISNSSTTIEEALAGGKDVLLWGYGARYSHAKQCIHSDKLNSSAINKEVLKREIIKFRSFKKKNQKQYRNIQPGVVNFVTQTKVSPNRWTENR